MCVIVCYYMYMCVCACGYLQSNCLVSNVFANMLVKAAKRTKLLYTNNRTTRLTRASVQWPVVPGPWKTPMLELDLYLLT